MNNNRDAHQQAAAEALHNLKAGDAEASEEQNLAATAGNGRARRSSTASKTAATLAAATALEEQKAAKTDTTPFPDNINASDDDSTPLVEVSTVTYEKGAWVLYTFEHEQPILARVAEDCYGSDDIHIAYEGLNRSVSQEMDHKGL